MLSDPIADLLSRIRNGYLAKNRECLVVDTKLNRWILKILHANGYIGDFQQKATNTRLPARQELPAKSKPKSVLMVTLIYPDGQAAIRSITRISKPGRRVYQKTNQIRSVLSGGGLSIISTSKGVMTDKQARKHKLGGEILCQVW